MTKPLDMVSEAFLIAWERRESFDPARASVKAWLFGIGTNLLRQHVRSEGRRLRAWARDHGRRAVADHVDDRTASVVDAKSLMSDLGETLADLRPEEREDRADRHRPGHRRVPRFPHGAGEGRVGPEAGPGHRHHHGDD